MSVMGESMAAMTNHMWHHANAAGTAGRRGASEGRCRPGASRNREVQDYKEGDCRRICPGEPGRRPAPVSLTNDANAKLADTTFSPTRPTSLLYYRTPTQRFKLEGVMFTDRPNATEDELNQRSR